LRTRPKKSAHAYASIWQPEGSPLVITSRSVRDKLAATLGADLAPHQGVEGTPMLPWVELTVTDCRAHPDIARQVREAAAPLRLHVLKVLPPASVATDPAAGPATTALSLSDLRPEEVFAERLRREAIDHASAAGQALVQTFAELMSGLHETAVVENPEARP
jgi:hypothetical protein